MSRVNLCAVILPLIGLTGCQTYDTDTPNYTIHLNRDYQSVADCASLKLSDDPSWKKTDYPSQGMSRLAYWIDDKASPGRIDFRRGKNGGADVDMYWQGAIWGKDFNINRYRPTVESCG